MVKSQRRKTSLSAKTTKPKKIAAKRKPRTVKSSQSAQLTKLIIEGIQEKKGQEIITLNLKKLKNSIADYFVICHADSKTQVDAIADSVEDFVYKKTKEKVWHKEGKQNAEWILLDYIDVVVHIFQKEQRVYYGLERLWGDAEMKKVIGKM